MANEQKRVAALQQRAGKLASQIEPSPDHRGYCLWRSWPGSGRQMVLGQGGGVTLDVIAQKLEEIEGETGPKKSGG